MAQKHPRTLRRPRTCECPIAGSAAGRQRFVIVWRDDLDTHLQRKSGSQSLPTTTGAFSRDWENLGVPCGAPVLSDFRPRSFQNKNFLKNLNLVAGQPVT